MTNGNDKKLNQARIDPKIKKYNSCNQAKNIGLNIFETLGIDYMSYRVQKNTRHLSVHT